MLLPGRLQVLLVRETPAADLPARLTGHVAPPGHDETGTAHLSDIVPADKNGRGSHRVVSSCHQDVRRGGSLAVMVQGSPGQEFLMAYM
eukprot:COSAG02_NODE_433_length_22435_cov_151.224078_3_plen_89_part_00